ncbi:mRNA interferase PemK [Clostridia bacterium]|nr:mRNA interferase PemK [Clostridia bacterium]
MGQFIKGAVVVLPFPFSDLTGSKRRPAFVLADLDGDDVILCQITSRAKFDPYAVAVKSEDFVSGALSVDSYVRPNKIFTADRKLILSCVGELSEEKTFEIVNSVISIVSQ